MIGLGAALLLVLAALAAGMRAPGPEAEEQVHRETLYVFGTLVEIEIRGAAPEAAREASAEVGALFDRLHREWHAWRPGALGRLNQAIAAGRPHRVGGELAALLERAKTLSEQSGGLFEPAIGGLIAAWGFHDDVRPEGAPPSPAEIAAWTQARPRMASLELRGGVARSANRRVQIDLGGFAKGAALDLAAEALRRRGIENAALNAGGDLTVLGRHDGRHDGCHDARAWRVAIRDPFAWGAVAALELRPGESLYTSGNYERFLEHGGERFSHIIDPRTGWPVRQIVSASVLDLEGARADAAATALSVAGPEGWLKTARAMGIEAALLIDADGAIHMTPAMRARTTILHEGRKVIVADPTSRIAAFAR